VQKESKVQCLQLQKKCKAKSEFHDSEKGLRAKWKISYFKQSFGEENAKFTVPKKIGKKNVKFSIPK
jgi:hypothetical protein